MNECKAECLSNDPLQFVHRYDRDLDIEAVALLSSCLAYGQAKQFIPKIELLLEQTAPAPNRVELEQVDLSNFTYRMTKGADVLALLKAIQRAQNEHGSLEALYQKTNGYTHLEKMTSWSEDLKSYVNCDRRGFRYLLPDPAKGSACKRLNMFFRWMVRDSYPDLGVWSAVEPSDLILPLDTHTTRLTRKMGLTDSTGAATMKAALDVTESLKEFDKSDPTKYDFVLAHIGISYDYEHEFWEYLND